uniref:C2 domain-containing protein n=1 Tax=Globisporangium ultimum (strain ATCC 200006 / CBS 805.95 / DAOM BR144) TaxID=431595 RepID=K3WRU1_GLOUD
MLRASLTPTENTQIDAFHVVLVIVMKRIVSILCEIQLFEQFEVLEKEEMQKFRHVHTTSADPNSEWIGRLINEIKVETRKDIVLHLEMELLELGASKTSIEIPVTDLEREEWIKLRAVRQKALQDIGGFFIQDRTNVLFLSYPNSFTGEGMISWILRSPSILWEDGWKKYCQDPKIKSSCLLQWKDGKLEQDPDAIQPPRSRESALMWLCGLSDAGYIENVTSSGAATDANINYYLVEDKTDRFYRLREVDLWLKKQSREKSLFPLDLVQEIDCYQSPLSGLTPADVNLNPEAEHKSVFSKKLTDHVEDFLGTHTKISTLLFSPEIKATDLLKPVVEKTKQLLDEDMLWDWKYCLFIPDYRSIYMYEAETCSCPFAIIDMNSGSCHASYSSIHEDKGGWFEISNATVFVRDSASAKYLPIDDERKAKMMKLKPDGSMVLEFKSADAQRWIQALLRAGVKMKLQVGQLVVMKQLNAIVLQQKCIEYSTEYLPHDLEGSFQRLLNRFFGHDLDSSHHEYEEKMRELRAQFRCEMKKTGHLGDTVLAYYGKGKKLNPKPTDSRSFTPGALYSGRIVRIRTPYIDSKYHVATLYDRNDKNEVPPEVEQLLLKYKVKDKASWLKLPTTLRDVFLLYDIEYRHSHETIIEEGMLREHFRAANGDLDAAKVEERCIDSNLLFKPNDLEDCVTRMTINCNGRKPLGCLKIPIKMVSPHRVSDVWYPLAPESEMVQKMHLGQLRVQLRLTHVNELVRSETRPALLEELKDAVAKHQLLQPYIPSSLSFFTNKRSARLPSGGSSVNSREQSFLKISIHEARKLVPSDVRQRNPFVKIVLLHEKNEKEEYTRLKSDVKPKTVNPKWQNQEFVLGKTEATVLSDKKAVLLRVLDEESVREFSLGCVKLEFQRDKSGFIIGLVLIHADAKGNPTRQALNLDNKNQIEVEAMLLGDEKARQDKSAKAKGNDAGLDGRLGKLRFGIELIKNENFVNQSTLPSPSKMAVQKHPDTKFSAEVKVKRIGCVNSTAVKLVEAEAFDWRQYTCVFQPHGEGGHRILYDSHFEDFTQGNKHRLSDLLQLGNASSTNSGDTDSSTSQFGSCKFLGRTYDVSKVSYFDVIVSSDVLGKTFQGKFEKAEIWKRPDLRTSFENEAIVLKDKDNKDVELQMLVDITLVGIHRAERLKRVLAETFRVVGLPFDAKTMNHHTVNNNQLHTSSYLQNFLWEVFRVNMFPSKNISQELMAQVHRMSRSTKLHWRFTPQLLSCIYEHVFIRGEKDLLSFRDAAALDIVLSRWSQIVTHVSEAKSQLIGHLHGQETPELVHAVFTKVLVLRLGS